MRAPDDRLHPLQPGVAGGADLLFREGRAPGDGKKDAAAFVEGEGVLGPPGPDDVAPGRFIPDVDEEVGDVARRLAEGGVARPHDADAVEKTHRPVDR